MDNVLDDTVGEAAAIWVGGWEQKSRRGKGSGKQNSTMNYLASGALGS